MPLSLYPGIYDTTVKWLPYFNSGRIDIRDPESKIFCYILDSNESLDISSLIVGETNFNTLVRGESFSINLPSLMYALTLHEFSILSSSELNAYGIDILHENGFFGGEGTQYNAILLNESPYINVVKNSASTAPEDEFFEFVVSDSLSDYPSSRDINFWISWTSLFDTGSFLLRICPPLPLPPIVEDFEITNIDDIAAYWSFDITSGAIEIDSTYPHNGTYGLKMYDTDDRYSSTYYQSAIIHVDLTSDPNATLDFWAKSFNGSPRASVNFSSDGVDWTKFQLVLGQQEYLHYSFNLDKLGLSLGDDFQIKFQNSSYHKGAVVWDDIRIDSNLDLSGPQVLEHSPTDIAGTVGQLSEITVTFNESIDASSFTSDDVALTDPQGFEITPVIPMAIKKCAPRDFRLALS